VTTETILKIMPHCRPEFVAPLSDAMTEFSIFTQRQQAAFLAQVAHESGETRYTLELATGIAYEGRLDLGNDRPGDGVHYKGRGLLQITGKANYATFGKALNLDLLTHPELLEAPAGACRSAAYFWHLHGLNELADADLFGSITKRINGGFNGIDSRLHYWLAARAALGVTP